MQINNINSPTFTGYRAETSKMNEVQKDVAHWLERKFEQCPDILEETDKHCIDIVLRPFTTRYSTLGLKYFDRITGKFIDTKKISINCLEPNFNQKKNFFDRMLDTLNAIYDGKIKRPTFDIKNFIKCKNNIAKMDKNLSELIQESNKDDITNIIDACQKYWQKANDVIMCEY